MNPTRKDKFKEHLHIANTTQIQPIRLKKNPNFHSHNLHITQNILTHLSKNQTFIQKLKSDKNQKSSISFRLIPIVPNFPRNHDFVVPKTKK